MTEIHGSGESSPAIGKITYIPLTLESNLRPGIVEISNLTVMRSHEVRVGILSMETRLCGGLEQRKELDYEDLGAAQSIA